MSNFIDKPVDPRGNSSKVWTYFYQEENGQSAKCKECQKILKTSGHSTSSLIKHLIKKHKIDIKEIDNLNDVSLEGNMTVLTERQGISVYII